MTATVDRLAVGAGAETEERAPAESRSVLDRVRNGYFIYRLAAIGVFFALWWLAARFWLDRVLPYPGETMVELWSLLTSSQFYEELYITVYRVIGGFVLAFAFGLILGTLMGLSKKVEAFAELAILTGVAAPGVFVAMIVLVSLGINNRAAMIGIAVISAPSITVSFWQATKALNRQLDEMAVVFGLSRSQRVRHLILPQLLPPALAASRYGLGFAWKLVVVLELLGLSNGVGYQVNFHFQLFDLTSVIAWTLGFLLFVLLVEYAITRPLERHLTHWRDHGVRKERRWLTR